MTRYFARVEYDGTKYHGFQRQENLPTIQACLEKALSSVAAEPILVVCGGRTDAGVHAAGQIIHFDTTAIRLERNWLLGANTLLPEDIALQSITPVSEEKHARFSATSRRYEYTIFNAPRRSPLHARQALWIYHDLDVNAMIEGAAYLLGKHDFSAFRGSDCQANSVYREVQELHIQQVEQMIYITIKANAFLQHMVRNIVGTLLEVGRGKASPIFVKEVLESLDRKKGGMMVPAHGLCLKEIYYA
jgi:tRNA pseudouridine38-40 synthase